MTHFFAVRGQLRTYIRNAGALLLTAMVTLCVTRLVLQPVVVHQASMAPSLEPGQRLFVNRLAYASASPARGDVIVFPQPGEASPVLLIKRVVGLPGEEVEIRSGAVYIDGRPLDEPYLSGSDPTQPDMDGLIVPQGHYFVLGDNRGHSVDSRDGWTVAEDTIVGKAWVAVWPFDRWGLSPNYVHADSGGGASPSEVTALRLR